MFNDKCILSRCAFCQDFLDPHGNCQNPKCPTKFKSPPVTSETGAYSHRFCTNCGHAIQESWNYCCNCGCSTKPPNPTYKLL